MCISSDGMERAVREETRSTEVQLSASEVWDYLADYDRVVRLGWEEGNARPLRATRRCAARYDVEVVWEGIRSTYKACLENADRPRTLTWSTRDGASKSWVRFDLEPLGAECTSVAVTLHYQPTIATRALEAFAWDTLQPALLQTVLRLQTLHEDLALAEGRR
jgi:hypothetical protein